MWGLSKALGRPLSCIFLLASLVGSSQVLAEPMSPPRIEAQRKHFQTLFQRGTWELKDLPQAGDDPRPLCWKQRDVNVMACYVYEYPSLPPDQTLLRRWKLWVTDHAALVDAPYYLAKAEGHGAKLVEGRDFNAAKAALSAWDISGWAPVEPSLVVLANDTLSGPIKLSNGATLTVGTQGLSFSYANKVRGWLGASLPSYDGQVYSIYTLEKAVLVIRFEPSTNTSYLRYVSLDGVSVEPQARAPVSALPFAIPGVAFEAVLPVLEELCAGNLSTKSFQELKDKVARGDLSKDDVAFIWNLTGAMAGFTFKSYPHWNNLYYGEGRPWLPGPCQAYMEGSANGSHIPKRVREDAEQVRAYWKTL